MGDIIPFMTRKEFVKKDAKEAPKWVQPEIMTIHKVDTNEVIKEVEVETDWSRRCARAEMMASYKRDVPDRFWVFDVIRSLPDVEYHYLMDSIIDLDVVDAILDKKKYKNTEQEVRDAADGFFRMTGAIKA
jgi:hypothetical protein